MNKYRAMAKNDLKNYNLFLARIENIKDEIEYLTEQAELVKISTSNLEGVPGGGDHVSPVEIQAEKHGKIKREIDRLNIENKRLQLAKRKIDSLINTLTGENKEILTRRFIGGEMLSKVCLDLCITEKWGRELSMRILDKAAFVLYGYAASDYNSMVR
ncbi:hypothetical protein SELR_25340 [Selenomonas ruminantium subsp. lactilytica TAM6421]|uniref:Phage transcriptional regulator, RinA family n=1 Tax=Selenomonas ruminantium subsp. lactilytica (strain NBRC 103574 / TAM6421) TaxID=927704 RepID=I0GU05_SELRL|nr:hypothetical protein [Selenomonas ruminantium]BAL84242.1 hypothetical protein SELR_25340 [Selenomonas ruminantium subsp. lactilytica TAM6421]